MTSLNPKLNFNPHMIWLLIIGLLILFNINNCSNNKTLNQQIKYFSEYEDSVKYYKSKTGDLIAYNNTLEINYKNLKKVNLELSNLLEDLKIKKAKTITKIETIVEIQKIEVPFSIQLPCDTFLMSFEHKEDWLSINGKISNENLYFDSIKLKNDLTVITGTKKNGLFKRNESIVAVKSENPYFQTTSLRNYNIKQEPAFYDKAWFKGLIFIGGLSTGILLSK